MKWLLTLALTGIAAAQSLSPVNPAVQVGGTQAVTASGFSGSLTCSVTPVSGSGSCACVGATCTYTAPTSLGAVNIDRGWSMSPPASVYNTRVDSLPVDTHSTAWLTRALNDSACPWPAHPECHHLRFLPQVVTFFSNPVNNSTTQQLMHFFNPVASNGYQDTNFPLPSFRTLMMECGFFNDVYPYVCDRHLLTTNTVSGLETEIYNIYPDYESCTFTAANPATVSCSTHTKWTIPQQQEVSISGGTGLWAGANGVWRANPTAQTVGTSIAYVIPALNSSGFGTPNPQLTLETQPPSVQALCPNCNSGGGQQFSGGSYAQLGGVDAAGMPLNALSVKMNEWEAATLAGRTDLGHAIRTTYSNAYLSARNIWPATLYAVQNAGFQNQILTCTNANPTVCKAGSDISQSVPCNYTYTAGCQFGINIFAIPAGSWSALNGDQTATAIDNTHFSLPINTSSFGAFPPAGGCPYAPCFVDDFSPYGATYRCKSSVDPTAVCGPGSDLATKACKVWINTCKRYGLISADGTYPGDNWDSGTVSSEYHPNELIAASQRIAQSTAIQPIENFLEVVNRSTQYGPLLHNPPSTATDLPVWQQANPNRTYISVTDGTHTVVDDMILLGTGVGAPKEKITVACGGTYPLNAYVTGNVNTTLTYGIVGISGVTFTGGSINMPPCASKVHGVVTASSADAAALQLYIDVTGIPASSDGCYRQALGNFTGDFLDSSGFTWYGAYQNNGFNNSLMAPGYWFGQQNGSWQGVSGSCVNDAWTNAPPNGTQVYSRSLSQNNDIVSDLALPSGNWAVTPLMEPGFGGFGPNNTCGTGAGQNVYDWQVAGVTVQSHLDGFRQAGNQPFNGYSLFAQTLSVSSGDPFANAEQRQRVFSTYGVSWSSLLVCPSSGPPPVGFTTTSPLPTGTQNVPYPFFAFSGQGGTPPYTYSVTSGAFPAGMSLASSGVLSGTPTVIGTVSPTVQICDTTPTCVQQIFSITINAPGGLVINPLPAFSMPLGRQNIPYTAFVTASRGAQPYTWCVLELSGACDNGVGALPAGLTITTDSMGRGQISGVPTVINNFRFTVRVEDSAGNRAFLNTSISILPAVPPPTGSSVTLTNGVEITGGVQLTSH